MTLLLVSKRLTRDALLAMNQRSKQAFKPGISPHTESRTVGLVMEELRRLHPDRYGQFKMNVPYAVIPWQKCDLCLGQGPNWDWAVEVKMLRFLGTTADRTTTS